MADIFKGSVDFSSLLSDIKAEVNKLKSAGEEAGEAVGIGFNDGIDESITTIKASSIKLSGMFKNLRQQILKQVQQFETNVNGKKLKLKIDFSDIDMDSEKMKNKIRALLEDFADLELVDFDSKGSQQQFENLIALYVKYSEKLENLQRKMQEFDVSGTTPEHLERNLQEQLAVARQIEKIYAFLSNQTNQAIPLSNEYFTIHNVNKYLEVLSKIKKESNEVASNNIIDVTKIDFSDVIKQLEEIKDAINGIKNAFEPLTNALSTEDSALHKIVTANINDLDTLGAKLHEVYQMIDTISNKQFNMTNVISNGSSARADIDQIRDLRREAKETFKQIEELYSESFTTGNKIKNTPQGLSDFLNFSGLMADFDMTDLAKRIKSRSAVSLGVVIDELNEWKKVLLQFNSLRNNVEAGSFNVSKYSDTSSKVSVGSKTTDEDDKKIVDTGTVDNDDILNKVKTLSEQIGAELASIRSKIEDTFNFGTIDPKIENIKTIADGIYQQFTDLQSKINALNFNIQVPTTVTSVDADESNIKAASDAMKEEGKSADDAVPKKNAFTEANKNAANSAKDTEEATKGAAEGIAIEAKAIEQSAGAIVEANDKFDKIKYLETADGDPISKTTTSTTKRENAYETESTYYKYNEELDRYIPETVTIVKDFKKRAAELKKESAKVELAKKTVVKFLSQFNNKTAGHGSDISGYTELKDFKIENLDDIETAMQRMIDLDTKYNELTRDFRKGTKSMNPFVNAFNSMDEMRNKVKSIQLDFDNLKSPTDTLRDQVKGLPALLQALNDALTPNEKGVVNIENIAKAYGNLNEAIKQANSSISLQNKEQKTHQTQEDSMWDAYNAEKNAAVEKERQIDLAYSQKAAEEAAESERILAQSRKEADEYFAAEDAKELNALYKERSTTITRIIQLNKKLNTLKTDKAKDKARNELESEKENLALIDEEINQYERLIDREKLQKQNKRLTDNQIDIEISAEQQKDVEAVNKALQRRKEIHEEIIRLKKQLDDADGYQEQSVIQKEIDDLKTLESVYINLLRKLSEGDNALQQKVNDQWNQLQGQDEKYNRQKKINEAADVDSAAIKAQKEDYKEVLSLVKQLHDAQTTLHKINVDPSNKVHTAEREKEIARVKELSKLLKEVYGIDIEKLSESLDKSSLLTQEQKNKLLEQEREYRQGIVDLTAQAEDKAATAQQKEQSKQDRQAQNYGKTIFNRETRYSESIDGYISSFKDIDFSSDFLNQIERHKLAYKELADLRNKFENDPSAVGNSALKTQFQEAALNVEKLRKELIGAFKEYQKLQNIPDDALLGVQEIDTDRFNDARVAMLHFANSVTDGKFEFEGFNAAGTEMYGVIDKGNGVLQNVTVSLNGVTNEMTAFVSGTKQATNSWSKLGNDLMSGVKQIAGMYIGFQEFWQAARQGVQYVREIDLALTELRKVTSETDLTYRNFLHTMSQTGSAIGATVSDLTSSAADWARLNI